MSIVYMCPNCNSAPCWCALAVRKLRQLRASVAALSPLPIQPRSPEETARINAALAGVALAMGDTDDEPPVALDDLKDTYKITPWDGTR